MGIRNLLQRWFPPKRQEAVLPGENILWRGWNEETEKLIAERNRPVLLFVPNPDPTVFPFLKAVFNAMPRNEKLRKLLNEYYYGLYIEVPNLPQHFLGLGAGSRYNIAVLSHMGFTPLAVIDPVYPKPEDIVETIRKVLEKLQEVY